MEQFARESLNNRVNEAKRYGEKIDLLEIIRHPVIGYVDDMPDPESLLLDKKGNPLPPFTDVEYKEEELRRIVGDRDLEEATQFLEQHGHYNELLLSRLSNERAFDYLYAIGSPVNSTKKERTRVYAERVVSADPDHLKAQLYLADTSPRSSSSDFEAALAQYESILVDHPDSPHALIEAAQVLMNLERPFQAVEYFQKGHELGARHGHLGAGIAYQQLGDYKTAWVYLKKALQVSESHRGFLVAKHLNAIKAGQPRIASLPIEKLDIPETGFLPTEPSHISDFDFSEPASDNVLPPAPDGGVLDDPNNARQTDAQAKARVQAKARFEEIRRIREQMSQQEITDFIRWAEDLMSQESAVSPTDFLEKEMAAHLTGKPAQFSPDRIVRANELIKRYGPEEGLERLQTIDPEIAGQLSIPEIKNMKKE